MNLPAHIEPAETGYDFDGVIADTAEAFIRIACEVYNYCSFGLDDITNFELEGCTGMPARLVEQIFTDILCDSLATGLQPMNDAVDVLGKAAAKGPITVITARHIEQPVIDWFNHFFPQTTLSAITLVAMGNHDEKLRYIRQHNLKYFIDDRAETCEMLAAGAVCPLVYSHPWNRHKHSLPTVDNWQDIRHILGL